MVLNTAFLRLRRFYHRGFFRGARAGGGRAPWAHSFPRRPRSRRTPVVRVLAASSGRHWLHVAGRFFRRANGTKSHVVYTIIESRVTGEQAMPDEMK